MKIHSCSALLDYNIRKKKVCIPMSIVQRVGYITKIFFNRLTNKIIAIVYLITYEFIRENA